MKKHSIINILLLALLLTTAAIQADTDQQKVKKHLLNNLANAQTEQQGRIAEGDLWNFWFNQSPTTAVRDLLDKGIERREAYDFEAAENYFSKVIEAAPEYSEGYNQRAFAKFLRENFASSLTDLEKALELEPNHFGAMAGMYQILRIQNRHEAAFELLRQAVILHPWIIERGSLPKEMWPDAYRKLHDPELEI